MLLLSAAVRQHRRMRRLIARTLVAVRGAWRLLDRHALDATEPRYLARVVPVVVAAQRAAAVSSVAYVREALAEQGFDDDPWGELVPDALVGVASDGRPLETLLHQPILRVKGLSAEGVPVGRAMEAGRRELETIVHTQVADVGRVATGVQVAVRERIGYVRMLVPPSCARCAVLVGRVYRYDASFLRHPRCDCISVPTRYTDDPERLRELAPSGVDFQTPREYFDSLSADEQDRIFGRAGAEAIRLGADIAQVVNARRGMYSTVAFGQRVVATTEGTTRLGLAGRRLIAAGARTARVAEELVTRQTREGVALRRVTRERVQVPRLMPEQILRDARDREDAVRLLRRFGYII